MPSLYIITGSNGAGKSTVGPEYLPLHTQEACTVYTSETEHKVLGVFINGEVSTAVASALLPKWFKADLPALADKIKEKEIL
jgi:hypothetical protein